MSDEQRQWTHFRLHFWVVSQATHLGMNSSAIITPWGNGAFLVRFPLVLIVVPKDFLFYHKSRKIAGHKPQKNRQQRCNRSFFLSGFALFFNDTMKRRKKTSH
jgi:hypothetical protein